jgi:hypothetical protein
MVRGKGWPTKENASFRAKVSKRYHKIKRGHFKEERNLLNLG